MQSIFKSKNVFGSKPLIIFNDIKLTDLIAVLNYAYTGEVQIPDSQLSSFLQTVSHLGIKGLIGNDIAQQQTGPTGCEIEPHEFEFTPTRIVEDVPIETIKYEEHHLNELTVSSRIDSIASVPEEYKDLFEKFSKPSNVESQPSHRPASSSSSNTHVGESRKKRQPKTPTHFSSFHLNAKDISMKPPALTLKACRFCGKFIKGAGPGIAAKRKTHEQKCKNNPSRAQNLSQCPVCHKSMGEYYLAIHLENIHGVKPSS